MLRKKPSFTVSCFFEYSCFQSRMYLDVTGKGSVSDPSVFRVSCRILETLSMQTDIHSKLFVISHSWNVITTKDCWWRSVPDIFFQGEKPITEEQLARLNELIEPWFSFALIWSIGATCDNDGRVKFSEWLREKMAEKKVSLQSVTDNCVVFGMCSVFCLVGFCSVAVRQLGNADA